MRATTVRSSVILSIIALALSLLGVGAATATTTEKARVSVYAAARYTSDSSGSRYGTTVDVEVDPFGADSPTPTPTGTVEVYDPAGKLAGTGTLIDGKVTIGAGYGYFDQAKPGVYYYTVRYLGDDTDYSGVGSAGITIGKDTPRLTVTASPSVLTSPAGRTTIAISAEAGRSARSGYNPGGTVTITGDGIEPISVDLVENQSVGASVEVGPFPHGGTYDLTVDYPETDYLNPAQAHTTVTVPDGATSTLSASVTQSARQARQQRGTVVATVMSDGTAAPTGSVSVAYRGHQVGTGTIADGSASVDVGPFQQAGTYPLTVSYGGDDATAPAASRTVDLVVAKARPRVVVYAPQTVKRGAQPYVTVKVVSPGSDLGGRVRLTYRGRSVTEALKGGSTVFRLDHLARLGSFGVRALYLGDATHTPAGLYRLVTVVRR